MSAITGIFMRNGTDVDPELMKKMNDKLSHRGPDGSAIWSEGSTGLGHQMLWTTPESLQETLPLEEDGLVITADARIDNRAELSEKLGIMDEEDVSDSYFILKAYAKWGEDCPDKLLGDFAFAVWDKQEEKLFCARDHMGVKPFYYYLDEDMFVFGTEIKALFEVDGVPREINELKIGLHLSLIGSENSEITFFKNIFSLSSANIMNINSKKSDLKNYWRLDPNFKIHLQKNEEYEKLFLDIFTEAVKCRLRSHFQIGSMLSGGLDSSSIACTAQKILKKDKKVLKTFSALFDSVPESNERIFIEEVLSHMEFDSYYIAADKINPFNEIDKFLWQGDNPTIPPNTFIIWNIYKKAEENRTRIVLDGFEGDTTVSHGDSLLLDLLSQKKFKKFFLEAKSKSRRLELNFYKLVLQLFSEFVIPKTLKHYLNEFRELNQISGSKTRIIRKSFKKKIKLEKIIRERYKLELKKDTAFKKHYYDLTSGMIQYEMEVVDWMAAHFSIEARHPFYDKRLVEFCLAIPSDQKFLEGWDRSILRRAMKHNIPSEIQWRKKKGNLSYNFKNSLMTEEMFLELSIFKEDHIINNYVDMKKIKNIYEKFKAENKKDAIFLWYVAMLSLWIKNNESQKKQD